MIYSTYFFKIINLYNNNNIMSGYIQSQLIEVNQGTSEEARSNNDENPAEFTNTFSDVISLEPGDKISLQSSFIAERGSGNTKTIELKGTSLGFKKVNYTKETKKTLDYPSKKIVELVYDEVEEDIEMFDNKTSAVLNYYKNMNGTGYVALPRKFIFNASNEISQIKIHGAGGADNLEYPWSTNDSTHQGYLSPVPDYDYMLYADHFIEKCSKLIKLKNDNSKYTVFVARASELKDTGFTQTTPVPSNSSQEPPNASWTIAPEYQDFYQYRELQTIEVPAGFNSADYVANEITRQLQQLQGTRDLIFRPRADDGSYPLQENNITSDTPISRVVDCATYKTFSCANEITMKDTQFNILIDDPTSASKWWQSFPTIAMKRPELYDTGKNINIEMNADGSANIKTPNTAGSNIKVAWNDTTAQDDTPLLLNIKYNASSLLLLKKFIDAQTLYPEVYDSFDQNIDEIYGMPTDDVYKPPSNDINGSNTRYFHMNCIPNASQIELDDSTFTAQEKLDRTSLGSSNYRFSHAVPDGSNASQRYSKLLLVYHQESDKDTFYENPKSDQYSYGCFRKIGTEPFAYVGVYPQRSSNPEISMPPWFLDADDKIEVGRKFGYDMHWTAPTTCAINIYNGQRIFPNFYGRNANAFLRLPNYNATIGTIFDGSGTTVYQTPLAEDVSQNVPFPATDTVPPETNPSSNGSYDQGDLFNLRYIGADSPKLNFDGEHFSFSQLHTAENLGNRSADGGRYANYLTGQTRIYLKGEVNNLASDPVYKINPFEDINEFCPALMPYRGQQHFFTANGSTGAGDQCINEYNTNYEPYQIYDSKSGIFFEDMGYTQDTWEDGLWGICGFSYNQFNGSANNRQLRVDGTNSKSLRYPTTNSEVIGSDTKTWVVNDNGIQLYSDNIPSPFAIATFTQGAPAEPVENGLQVQIFPNITQKTTSTNLVADNFPRSMLRGYYTIRTDLIADSLFVGGKSNITNMPIVGVVTKENPQNDFYFGVGDVEFTIGKPTRLSSVRVSIHDPNGSYANVNKNSAVIFKVQRQMNVSFNIAEEILASEKGKKKSNL